MLAAAVAMTPVGVAAADLDINSPSEATPHAPVTPAPAPAQQTLPTPPIQPAPATTAVLAAPDAACLEWTDDCRTCQKPAGGEASCSNVSIACVQKASRCTKR
jgi:hypothetical protein